MTEPSLEFLCVCIVEALLAHYRVTYLPVPVRVMLQAPPPDLARDLSLTETAGTHGGDALWLRTMGAQGSVFVNTSLPEPSQRYGMARALFTALCASEGGQAVGLPPVPNNHLRFQGDLFARRLLLPRSLLPNGWERLPPQSLAGLCGVPVEVAEAEQREHTRRLPLVA
jgi:hypothetical protein